MIDLSCCDSDTFFLCLVFFCSKLTRTCRNVLTANIVPIIFFEQFRERGPDPQGGAGLAATGRSRGSRKGRGDGDARQLLVRLARRTAHHRQLGGRREGIPRRGRSPAQVKADEEKKSNKNTNSRVKTISGGPPPGGTRWLPRQRICPTGNTEKKKRMNPVH